MSDDRLKQKLEHLAKKVHEELVEIERAMAPSAALQLSGDQAVPSARQRRREGATPPRKEKRPRDHSKRLKRHAGIARTRNAGPTVRTCFGHMKLKVVTEHWITWLPCVRMGEAEEIRFRENMETSALSVT